MSFVVLDGGMGRELQRIGAPFRQPEWSALALMDGPDWVVQAHRNFIEAGASIITTNSYACVPFHLGESRFQSDGARLVKLAGELARRAATESTSPITVAGSIPPVFGSYRPDLFVPDAAAEILDVIVDGLDPFVDIWLIETTGSIAEALAALKSVRRRDARPIWMSFTLNDVLTADGGAVLRSRESITEALSVVMGIEAVLFNCSQPEVMLSAVTEVQRGAHKQLTVGVYANAFPPVTEPATANEGLSAIRTDLTPQRYAEFAQSWIDAGATVIGGCCGITPTHLAALARL